MRGEVWVREEVWMKGEACMDEGRSVYKGRSVGKECVKTGTDKWSIQRELMLATQIVFNVLSNAKFQKFQ